VPQLLGALGKAGSAAKPGAAAAAAALEHIAKTHLSALVFPLRSAPLTAAEAVSLLDRASRAHPRLAEFAQVRSR
jgi:hypothetical protein